MKVGKTDGSTPAQLKWYVTKISSRLSLIRRYYNIDTNTCSEFYFNGKGGNENQFDSHAVCMNTCYLESAESEEAQVLVS